MRGVENSITKLRKDLFSAMLKIRLFEEKIIEVYPQQEMKTPVHLCIGQEAIAAGVCANLKQDDFIFSTHRNHGHYIAKGGDIKLLIAELYGKVTGCSGGKGGSMHSTAPEFGIFGTSAIVGGCIPLAVGTALASKMKKDGKVSVAFFGDGAADEGTFQESLNFASLKKLPVVFVCENNFYATNSHLSARQPVDNISDRAGAYEIGGVRVNGNDVVAIYDAANIAVDNARGGKGPSFIECRTYRWKGHVGPECDHEKGCRPKKELEDWMEKCPVSSYRELLLKDGTLSEKEIKEMKMEIDAEIKEALSFAKESPFPSAEELFKDVYSERG